MMTVALDREKAIKVLKASSICFGDKSYDGISFSAADVAAMIEEQPEIVMCKDCKNAEPAFDGKTSRCKIRGLRKNNWFCADGKRRDDNV